jgi:hypothetical protein
MQVKPVTSTTRQVDDKAAVDDAKSETQSSLKVDTTMPDVPESGNKRKEYGEKSEAEEPPTKKANKGGDAEVSTAGTEEKDGKGLEKSDVQQEGQTTKKEQNEVPKKAADADDAPTDVAKGVEVPPAESKDTSDSEKKAEAETKVEAPESETGATENKKTAGADADAVVDKSPKKDEKTKKDDPQRRRSSTRNRKSD